MARLLPRIRPLVLAAAATVLAAPAVAQPPDDAGRAFSNGSYGTACW